MTIKSGTSAASRCRQFQANRFDKIRCQACFRPRQEHCKEALECGKAARKAIRCGYLFLAPDNLDFGDLSQRKRRWQRRFFALFDDGQLIYALDQRPETIPHGSIDLLHCCGIDLFSPSAAGGLPEAEPVLAVRFAAPAAAEIERDAGAPTICNSVYVRAENLEETKRWFEGLREFVKENASASVVKGLALAPNFTGGDGGANRQNQSFDERNFQSGQPAHIQWTTETGATAIRIGASSPSANGNAIKVDNDKSEPEETQRSKLARCVSGCYGTPRVNRRVSEPMPSLIDRILSPPNSSPVASVSHSKQSSQSSFNNSGSSSNHHGSVRSVKHRAAGQKNLEQCQSHTEKPLLAIDVDSVSTVAMASPSSPPICVVAQQPSAVGNDLTRSQGAPQQLQEHTVRKGWLMLRGRSADEWHKHWVVLTGLSWTENNNTCEGGENSDDSNGKPVVDIDMSSCERVYPIGVSRNYGIEIRMPVTLNRKKRIAHVAPNDTRMSPEPETTRNEPPSLAENVAGVREFSEQAIGYRRHLRGVEDHGEPNVLRQSAYAHASVNRRTPPSLSRALGVSSAENAVNSQRDREGFSYSEPSIGVESSTADEQSSELNVRNFRDRDGNNAATSATVRSRRRRSRCRLPPRQNSDSDDNSDNSTNQHSSLSPKLARRSPLGRVKQRKRVKSGSANGAAPAEDGPTASNTTPRSSVDDNERAASDYIQLKTDGADIEAAVEGLGLPPGLALSPLSITSPQFPVIESNQTFSQFHPS